MTGHRAVLFDLDGTLLDTLKDLADATNYALREMGFPEHHIQSYRYFVGSGRDALALRALPENRREAATLRELSSRIGDEYSKRWRDSTTPYPGIPELLDSISARNIPMAILSNKPYDMTEMAASELLGRWRFDAVLGLRPSTPAKPDPTGALRIASQLGISPTCFIYLGDSDVDMKAATAANMLPVGALWGFRTAAELLAAGAKEVIEEPMDFLHLL